MKHLLLAIVLFASTIAAHAEIHCVGVDIVRRRPDDTIRVSLTSVVPEEAKKGISIDEAAKILRNVKGSGSVVFVGIIVHDVFPLEYLPILRAIAENGADIAFIDNDQAEPMKSNVHKEIIDAR